MKRHRPYYWFVAIACLALSLFGWSASYAQETETKDDLASVEFQPVIEIGLDRDVHFLTPQGVDTVVPSGAYTLETLEGGLILTPSDEPSGKAVIIQAETTTHVTSIESSQPVSMPVEEDQHVVILLLPDGKAMQAVGSYSGVHPRGFKFKPGVLKGIVSSSRRSPYRRNYRDARKYSKRDTVPAPKVVGLQVNAGARSTGKRTVNLKWVTQGDATHHRVGETSNLSGVSWTRPAQSPRLGALYEFRNDSAGQKTIYLQIKNSTTVSPIVSARIEYRKPPKTYSFTSTRQILNLIQHARSKGFRFDIKKLNGWECEMGDDFTLRRGDGVPIPFAFVAAGNGPSAYCEFRAFFGFGKKLKNGFRMKGAKLTRVVMPGLMIKREPDGEYWMKGSKCEFYQPPVRDSQDPKMIIRVRHPGGMGFPISSYGTACKFSSIELTGPEGADWQSAFE